MGGGGSYWTPPGLTRDTQFVEPDGEDYYYTDKIGEEAARQIEAFATKDKPFFQYVAFTAAHWPIHAPEKTIQKYIERYRGGWEKLREDRYARMLKMGIIDRERWPLPPMEPGVADWESVDHKAWHIRNMAVYAAMVDHMDQAVGRIVDALRRTGQLDNTLIVYMHDNGACSEHLSGNGWGTANNVLAWAEKNGKTIAVGDQYDTPMGGPLTYGSVGHNWANAQNTPLATLQGQCSRRRRVHALHHALARRDEVPRTDHPAARACGRPDGHLHRAGRRGVSGSVQRTADLSAREPQPGAGDHRSASSRTTTPTTSTTAGRKP